jgi:hypothetical protein
VVDYGYNVVDASVVLRVRDDESPLAKARWLGALRTATWWLTEDAGPVTLVTIVEESSGGGLPPPIPRCLPGTPADTRRPPRGHDEPCARMDWCVADVYKKANHNPSPVLNGDHSKKVLSIAANGGTTVKLSAEGTRDPDGNAVRVAWWIYKEAGS